MKKKLLMEGEEKKFLNEKMEKYGFMVNLTIQHPSRFHL